MLIQVLLGYEATPHKPEHSARANGKPAPSKATTSRARPFQTTANVDDVSAAKTKRSTRRPAQAKEESEDEPEMELVRAVVADGNEGPSNRRVRGVKAAPVSETNSKAKGKGKAASQPTGRAKPIVPAAKVIDVDEVDRPSSDEDDDDALEEVPVQQPARVRNLRAPTQSQNGRAGSTSARQGGAGTKSPTRRTRGLTEEDWANMLQAVSTIHRTSSFDSCLTRF